MDLQKMTFKIRFQDISLAEAGEKAARLRQEILDSSPNVRVQLEKEDPLTQDPGTILAIILAGPAIVEIAKGIANYLSRERGKIIIEKNGKIIAEGISGADAARIMEALSSTK